MSYKGELLFEGTNFKSYFKQDLTSQPPQACDFSHELGGFSLDL